MTLEDLKRNALSIIADEMRSPGGATGRFIAEELGEDPARVRRVCKALAAEGRITATPRKRYDRQEIRSGFPQFGGAGVVLRRFYVYEIAPENKNEKR